MKLIKLLFVLSIACKSICTLEPVRKWSWKGRRLLGFVEFVCIQEICPPRHIYNLFDANEKYLGCLVHHPFELTKNGITYVPAGNPKASFIYRQGVPAKQIYKIVRQWNPDIASCLVLRSEQN